MTESIRITVPGPPPRKNERHVLVYRGGHPSRKNSAKFDSFAMRLHVAWSALGLAKIERGVYSIMVCSFWPKQRHFDDVSVPNGDSDAALSCVKDALQIIGAIDNDARIVGDKTASVYDKDAPRVEISLVPVPTDAYQPAKKRRKAKAA